MFDLVQLWKLHYRYDEIFCPLVCFDAGSHGKFSVVKMTTDNIVISSESH